MDWTNEKGFPSLSSSGDNGGKVMWDQKLSFKGYEGNVGNCPLCLWTTLDPGGKVLVLLLWPLP